MDHEFHPHPKGADRCMRLVGAEYIDGVKTREFQCSAKRAVHPFGPRLSPELMAKAKRAATFLVPCPPDDSGEDPDYGF